MGISLQVMIELDADHRHDNVPFTGRVSVWDLSSDMPLCWGKDYWFINAITVGLSSPERPGSWSQAMRGFPERPMQTPEHIRALSSKYDDYEVTWFTAAELDELFADEREAYDRMNPESRVVLETVRTLAATYGRDRVRLLVAVSD